MKHRLSRAERENREDCFDRIAALNPSWVNCSITLYGQPPLSLAAVAQNSNLNVDLERTPRRRILQWLSLITPDSTSGQRPWSSSHIHDDDEDGECRLKRNIRALQAWRVALIAELLEGVDVTRPMRMPGQVKSANGSHPMRVFTTLKDSRADRRAATERCFDTAILQEIDQRHTGPATLLESFEGPPAIVLQVTSAANDLELEVDESGQELPIDQDGPVARAKRDDDSGHGAFPTGPDSDSNECSTSTTKLSEEVFDTARQHSDSDTLCASIASTGSTLVEDWAPQPTFVTAARPVDFSSGDIWDEYAC